MPAENTILRIMKTKHSPTPSNDAISTTFTPFVRLVQSYVNKKTAYTFKTSVILKHFVNLFKTLLNQDFLAPIQKDNCIRIRFYRLDILNIYKNFSGIQLGQHQYTFLHFKFHLSPNFQYLVKFYFYMH